MLLLMIIGTETKVQSSAFRENSVSVPGFVPGHMLNDTIINFTSYLHKGYQVVDPDSAIEMLKKDNHLKIIDTRFPNVFAQGHLINAINIDKNDVTLLDKLDKFNKSENYLLYGNTDNENTMMIHTMRQHNFTGNIYDLAGGYKRWIEKNLPTAM